MPLYEWSESMSVGVPQLDADHKAIIRLINRLHESLQSGSEAADLGEIFDKLVAYIEWHFAREEEIMEVCGYPGVARQRAEHQSFARYIYKTRDMYRANANLALARVVLNYLRNWMEDHIQVSDMAYRPYVEGNPNAYEAARDFGPGLDDDEQLERAQPGQTCN